ncbi:hypothetical protein AO277_17900 [Pseudomonas amygdali]|nr:hypothetical protein AO277_17900 [Pseudomonas amygdali]
MPQVVKAQIDQEVFLRRYLRHFAISQVFQPCTLQTSHKGLLERTSRDGEDSPAQLARQILEQLNSLRRKRDGSGQAVLGCGEVRGSTIQVHMLPAQLKDLATTRGCFNRQLDDGPCPWIV